MRLHGQSGAVGGGRAGLQAGLQGTERVGLQVRWGSRLDGD